MIQEIDKVCDEFEVFLKDSKPVIKSFHPYFEDATWEMVINGGKRFRPRLLFGVVLANAPELLPNSFKVALALEVFHTYSLIHDDLPCMDNADLRRGHTTLHKKYGETLAVLVGDALNTYAFNLLARAALSSEVKISLIEVLSSYGGIEGMVLGQALDCYFENQKLPLDKLELIHLNKTARLISAALKMGGLISVLDSKALQALEKFGMLLGLYFQVLDDVMDVSLSMEVAGKTTNNDANKNSYVNLLGLQGSMKKLEEIKKALEVHLQEIQRDINPKTKQVLESIFLQYSKDFDSKLTLQQK
ncbi:geranyl transferase [Helicobacter sp. 13S00401-1]|uniref:polyprenyl synthetase family protein n=1 Tax=Helicobacter sp. 13S00401-1 TaxID=1905758 RepID=UPI000BA7A4C7|nr:polyprenyl synthetase family protein [Helicobacter sp. 13S00401-1]PAF50955.1 geranyl transferase [Helicobacter sp. 13S00401-1]